MQSTSLFVPIIIFCICSLCQQGGRWSAPSSLATQGHLRPLHTMLLSHHHHHWHHWYVSISIDIIDINVSNTLVIIMMIIIMATATDSFYFLIKFLLPHQCDAPLNSIITSDQTNHPVQHNHPQSAVNAPLDREDPQWTLGSDLHNNSSINNYQRSAVFRMGKLNCLKSTNHLNLCF